MSEILNPAQLARQMQAVLERLDALLDNTVEAGRELAEAEKKYKVAFAKSRMAGRAGSAKLTVDATNDRATVDTEQELFDYRIAEQTMVICRESLRVEQAKLDALRSMSASVRGAGG